MYLSFTSLFGSKKFTALLLFITSAKSITITPSFFLFYFLLLQRHATAGCSLGGDFRIIGLAIREMP
jgi:hypothetical protein